MDVYQLIIGGTTCGQPVEVVLHYEHTASSNPDPQIRSQNLINGFNATIDTSWLDCLPANHTQIGYKCKRVNNGGGPTVVFLSAAGVVGTRAGNANDSCIGPVIAMPYTDGTRWHAGRIFLPGISEDDIDNNQLDAALVANLNTLNGILITPVASGGDNFTQVVWSRKNSLAYTPHIYNISNTVGVQRRRLHPTF